MGAGQSLPSTLTRDKVFELTRNTRNVMDILLEYMLKEVTVRDFVALSNPVECKKYVIFMANNLYKHFYELQIVPTKDKRGVIAFRPVKELVNPSEGDINERQSLCLTLSYFYTRIFQIYGALALTLLDDSKYMMESGIISMYGDTTKKGLLPPGYRPYSMGGGAPPSNILGNFNFLRDFLYDDKDPVKGYYTKYVGESSSKGVVYFSPKNINRDRYGRPLPMRATPESMTQYGVFHLGYTGAKKYATLNVFAKLDGIGGDIKFTFGKLNYIKKDSLATQSIDLDLDILGQRTLTILHERTRSGTTYTYSIRGSAVSIVDYFNQLFNRIIIYLRELIEGDTISYGISSDITSGTKISETGVPEELRLGRIIQNLTKTKPLGHCLARALQLLRTVPFKGEPGISHVCKAKFFEQTVTSPTGVKTVVSRSGVPQPGTTLDSSPGLAALSQLFYDTVLIGTPKIVIGQQSGTAGKPSSLEQYISFMKTMGRLFGDTSFETSSMSNDTIKAGLKGIQNKRDNELCGNIKTDIPISPSVVGNVYDIVNQLYKIQLEHSAKCGQVFKLLFDIQQDKSSGRYRISLSNNIIKKGFPEIERLNFMAREILVQYYTNCELKYLQGMKIVLDSTKISKPST